MNANLTRCRYLDGGFFPTLGPVYVGSTDAGAHTAAGSGANMRRSLPMQALEFAALEDEKLCVNTL
jgi:hypothetical protein